MQRKLRRNSLVTKYSAYVEGLSAITRNPFWRQEVKPISALQPIRAEYQQCLNSLDREDTQYRCCRESTARGRPKFVNQLVGLQSLNLSCKAKMLGVSETILRWRYASTLPPGEDTYTNISDTEQDNTISFILGSLPNSGKRIVMGALTARNTKVKRGVRAPIFCVDPVNRML